MLSLPLPFVVVLFLGFFLLSLIWADKPWTATRLAFAGLLGLGILHGTITGLVWSYGLEVLRPVLPVLASLLPVALWLAFRSMAQGVRRLAWSRIALHLAPTVLIAALILALSVTGASLVDPILVASFLAHGVLLWRMGAAGPDGFQQSLLHRAASAAGAAKVAGLLLILNALVDVSIIVDFQMTGGRYVPTILSAISVVILLLLAVVAARGTNAASEEEGPEDDAAPDPALPAVTEDHRDTVAAVDRLMQETRLFTDPNLTLIKIARRAGIPAREISTAINRQNGMNVSQYINRLRLEEACRQMAGTDKSITEIHLDAGFQTKSNFNREFKRQFGCSPSQWRAGQATSG